jgi:hypothetical protein
MLRSLPERTVDAWVSSAVCTAFPHARIWGPTQNMEEANWDYGLSLGDGKILVFEDKGTTPVQRRRKRPLYTHRIYIDLGQLDWYCDRVEPTTGAPVYYVLPQPPWIGAATGSGITPDQAICRVNSVAGLFDEWAFVSRASDLRKELGGRRNSIDTDQLPFADAISLTEFFRRMRACQVGKRISGSGDSSSLVAKAPQQAGQLPVSYTADRIDPRQQQAYVGSAIAVFVPAQDLPGWSS